MVAGNIRGSIYDPVGDNDFDMGTLTDEDVSLSGGLFRQALPLTKAQLAIFESIFGKTRILRLEGFKTGTQAQHETFIKQFTDLMDISGLLKVINYHPLIHQDNTLAGSGGQDAFFVCLFNDFSYRLSREQAGFVLFYDIELFQGIRVLG